jgi:hypothetical protein
MARELPNLTTLGQIEYRYPDTANPLAAEASPIDGWISIPLSAWDPGFNEVMRKALFGHESGHVILSHLMTEELKGQPIKELAKFLPTDSTHLRKEMGDLERRHPKLSTASASAPPDVPLEAWVQHQAMGRFLYHAERADSQIRRLAPNLQSEVLAKVMVALYCDALHEVFSDFIAASFSEDKNFARALFPKNLVDQYIRCFGFNPDDIGNVPGLAEAILETGKRGDCHVALLLMRWAIYEKFYLHSRVDIGEDLAHDAKVAGVISSSLAQMAIHVLNPRRPTAGTGALEATAAAFCSLIYGSKLPTPFATAGDVFRPDNERPPAQQSSVASAEDVARPANERRPAQPSSVEVSAEQEIVYVDSSGRPLVRKQKLNDKGSVR